MGQLFSYVRAWLFQSDKSTFNDSKRRGIDSLLKHEDEDEVRRHLGESTEEKVDVSVAGQFTSAQRQPVVDQRYRHPAYEALQNVVDTFISTSQVN